MFGMIPRKDVFRKTASIPFYRKSRTPSTAREGAALRRLTSPCLIGLSTEVSSPRPFGAASQYLAQASKACAKSESGMTVSYQSAAPIGRNRMSEPREYEVRDRPSNGDRDQHRAKERIWSHVDLLVTRAAQGPKRCHTNRAECDLETAKPLEQGKVYIESPPGPSKPS